MAESTQNNICFQYFRIYSYSSGLF